MKHAIDVGDESHIRYLDDDIEWVTDRLVKVSGNVNNSIDQYLIFDASKGTLLRSYVVSDCALSWSPAKDKIALCGFYPPTTPEEYQSNGLQIDETPMLPIKGRSFMDSQDALGSIYPSETELEKEPEKSVHKFETEFLWSPNGKQMAFIDELQQVVADDATKLLGRYLIIVNVLEKTSTKIPLPELSFDNIKHPDDVGKSIRWSKDGRFIRLDNDNLSFDTGENKFIKEIIEPEIKPDSKVESNNKHHE